MPPKNRHKGDTNDYTEKIAVIGGGPAGLSCAYYLAEMSYPVTVFDRNPVPGGMLTMGIPSFRLEKDVVEAEIDILREMGVEFKCGVEVGKDVTIQQLREEGYRGFYLAIGAQKSASLRVPGETLEGAISLHRFVHPGHSLTLARNPRDFVALDKDNLELDPECFDRPARQQVRHDKRKVKTMHDDRLPFTEEQVKAEASRCLGCGATYVDQNRCIGCGICTTRCKFDAIHLVRNHPEFANYYNGDHSKEIVMLSGVKRAGHIAIKELKKAVSRNG